MPVFMRCRLQHGQLPRCGPRQGRVSAVAVRLRSRRATTIGSPARSASGGSTWPCPREPAAREGDRRGAAHRRQAVRAGQRVLPDAAPLAAKPGAPDDAGEPPHVIGVGHLSAAGGASRATSTTQQFIARAHVQRRHRSRRDRPGRVLTRTTTTRRRSTPDGLVDRRRAGRSVRDGPLRDEDRGQPGAGAARRTCSTRRRRSAGNYIDELVGAKLHEAADPAQRALQRRGVSAPRDDRHHRPAADREEYQAFMADTIAGQAGQADRPAARAQGVRRNLGHEVGRAADGQVEQPGQLQVDVPLQQLADRTRLPTTCRSTRWSANCSAPAAARSATRRPTSTRSNATR